MEPGGEFRPVDGGRVALALVELAGLKGARVALLGLRDVEDDDVRVELRRGVAVHGSGAVMFEPGRDPLTGRLGGMIGADAGLDVALELVQGDCDTLLVRLADALILSNVYGTVEGRVYRHDDLQSLALRLTAHRRGTESSS